MKVVLDTNILISALISKTARCGLSRSAAGRSIGVAVPEFQMPSKLG